jgi:tRNA pseudouridine38-40 synthase
MTTQRYKLAIAYRGTRYHGWQKQRANETYKGAMPAIGEGIPTIQEELTKAIVSVVRHPVTICGASRTDSGVHAKGQVAHFDTTATQIPPDGMRHAVNARLPGDIVVRSIEPMQSEFDAIGDVVSKRYQYCIWCHPDRPVFANDLWWHRWQPLDVAAMREAAAHLVGKHDFASFCKPGHGREHTVRTILSCDVSHRGPQIVIGVAGTGFLWNMVRIIAGTLAEVGSKRIQPSDMPTILAAKDRQAAGGTAPPEGLFLQWIRYGPPGSGRAARDEARRAGEALIESPLPPGEG